MSLSPFQENNGFSCNYRSPSKPFRYPGSPNELKTCLKQGGPMEAFLFTNPPGLAIHCMARAEAASP